MVLVRLAMPWRIEKRLQGLPSSGVSIIQSGMHIFHSLPPSGVSIIQSGTHIFTGCERNCFFTTVGLSDASAAGCVRVDARRAVVLSQLRSYVCMCSGSFSAVVRIRVTRPHVRNYVSSRKTLHWLFPNEKYVSSCKEQFSFKKCSCPHVKK